METITDVIELPREDAGDDVQDCSRRLAVAMSDGMRLVAKVDVDVPENDGTLTLDDLNRSIDDNRDGLVVRTVDDETWQRVASGDIEAWRDAMAREGMDATGQEYDMIFQAAYGNDYETPAHESIEVRGLALLGSELMPLDQGLDYHRFVAEMSDGTYVAANASMWENFPNRLEYVQMRVMDKATFDNLVSDSGLLYERHDTLAIMAEQQSLHTYAGPRTTAVTEAIKAGRFTPTNGDGDYMPPTRGQIEQALRGIQPQEEKPALLPLDDTGYGRVDERQNWNDFGL